MCNSYEQQVAYAAYRKAVEQHGLDTPSSESASDLPQADDLKIGDIGPVLVASGNGVELKPMTFGWPAPRPKASPVFNFKSDGRSFKDSRRCVIVLSGFFEFVGTKYPKAKYRFALAICISAAADSTRTKICPMRPPSSCTTNPIYGPWKGESVRDAWISSAQYPLPPSPTVTPSRPTPEGHSEAQWRHRQTGAKGPRWNPKRFLKPKASR